MTKIREIHIPGGSDVFKHLAHALLPYHTKAVGSYLFIVEGTLTKPRIGIRYPGRKLEQRILKKPNKNSALWANLFDFEVVPFEKGKESSSVHFTYANLLKDFEMHKKENASFWKMIVRVHNYNEIDEEPPKLGGIDSRQFLEMLKWMWIQEDLNYKLSWREVGSEMPYRLQNKNGKPTSKGAGRDKFYATLILVHGNHFDAASMRKIIP
ncbi:MAG: hypothetical protein NTY93_02005 [Candidatus Kaiserbacteria bacterium]|nr:hypothetical protein [Candidatus Kaiserbacteria bacterium]